MRHQAIVVIVALTLGAFAWAAAGESERPRDGHEDSHWREIAWPMPRDGWPAGRAFRCTETACGGNTELYVRPKRGFCNCDTGVTDDDEVDRVADIDLISTGFAPRAPGEAIRGAGMPGRLRRDDLAMPDGERHIAVGIAVSHRCDLLVAVAQGKGDAPQIERAAIEFLETADMTRWMGSAME